MTKDKFTSGPAGPVRHGCGTGDIMQQAKQYTANALALVNWTMENAAVEKLSFAAAKYLLELAWGRPTAMKQPEADETADPQLQADILAMIDEARRQRLAQAKPLGLTQ